MAFCGHCGLLQPPGVVTCPRCGAAVTPDGESTGQDTDNPTIISALDKTEQSGGPYSSKPGFVQEPGQFVGYDSPTQGVERGENTPTVPSVQHMPFPGYDTQPSASPPPLGYIPQSDGDFSTTEGVGSYPGPVLPGDRGNLPPPTRPQETKSRGTLLVTLLILFLVGATVVATTAVFVVGPARVLQIVTGGAVTSQPTSQISTSTPLTPTSQVPTPTPTLTAGQQAQSVIARYYAAINSKDYQTAYNLWVNYPASYQEFANGFADTQHDDYQFGQVLQQSDGTVQVYLTLVATSTSSQQTTYQGYYIVGQQSDGSWKIVKGSLSTV